MRFTWPANTKRRWQIWESFSDLLAILEKIDGPSDTNPNWLLEEVEVVGESNLSAEFIKLYESGKRYANPNQSTLAYFMGITKERPSNPARNMRQSQARLSMPDIDLDVEDRYRDKLLNYIRDTYGYEKTAQIVTFGEIGAKKAVRDVARVLDLPYELGDRLSKAMPPPVFGRSPTLEMCLQSEEFRRIYETDADAKRVVDASRNLEGLWRDRSMHAGAILVADRDISDYVPIARLSDKEDAPVVIQWDFIRAEECGLLKIDCLGLRNLSVIHMCMDTAVRLIKERGMDPPFDPSEPFTLLENPDPEVFKMLSRGQNIGVFQMEGSGFRDLMLALRPTDINDIAAMLALYRPGPMGSGVHVEYSKRKNGLKPVTYLHESLEPILNDTYGLLLYQEQLLEMAKKVAGMDTFQADYLRGVVGKKKVEAMPGQRNRFVQGCIDHAGMPRQTAERLFNEIEHHASYSFSKNHSFAYGFISYVTAYLKVRYPIEYMTALLTSVSQSHSTKKEERLRLYLNECKNLGIEVRRPSINASGDGFAIVDDSIIFGFDGVKGFAASTIETLVSSQIPEQPFTNLYDFMRRTSAGVLNRKNILTLLRAGALDELLTEDSPAQQLKRNERVGVLFEEAQHLGVFLGRHPFTELQDLVLDKVSHTISELNPEVTESVKVGGIITSVVKKSTKTGKRMYNLTIEDDTSSIDVVVFPKVAEELDDDKPFTVGELLIMTGRVRADQGAGKNEDEDEETIKLIFIYSDAEKIDYSAVSTEPPIYLKSDKPLNMIELRSIEDIINATKGPVSVIIESPLETGEKVKFRFNQTTNASAEPILKKLIEVF